jgi:recombinational DNA repair protein RecT
MADSNQFLALLEKEEPKIKPLIAPYFDKDLWFQNAKAMWKAVQRDEKLRACSTESLVGCVEEAARRGLEIGGPNKHCAPVAFKTTAILITQWQGKVFIWMKSGAIKKLMPNVVYVGDEFEISSGDDDHIKHVPSLALDEHPPEWLGKIDNIVGAYAIATLWSGEKVRSFVTRAYMKRLIEWVKKKNNGVLGFGYNDWMPEMFMKTAVHRLDGKIQPPPHMDKDQIEAWGRAAAAANIDVDFTRLGEDDPDPDMPTAARTAHVEVVPDNGKKPPKADLTQSDRPVTMSEANELSEIAEAAGLSFKKIKAVLKEFGVEDFEFLKASQVADVGKALAAAAQ